VLGLGGFLAINAAFGQLLAAATELARAAATALELVPLFERLRPIIAAAPEARGDKSEAGPLSGRIEVSHVTFRYAEGSRIVLDDVSLRIEPGAFVAFVGPSGGGKSSLLRLLLGFETAESGDILYDGQSIRTLDTASLRHQIGVVLQHGRITTGSIFENITSRLPYTLDEARAAARLAGIDADIEAMPMGMHTLLIEGSSTLSGGQRQRLMIARALIGRPRLLFFDAATSAFDNRSQALVVQSLEKLRTTRVVVAPRLSTIERADRMFVFETGRLVEAGSFAELIGRDGLFSRLARR
jgi:ABC-type bacteriocin/lantibiotic exporter with double-glycine peptidase domain